jgi:FdhE protein
MPRTTGGLRTDASARLAELGAQRPEWSGWIRLLEEVARHESRVAGRETRVTSRESRVASRELGFGNREAPLLQHRVLRLDAAEARQLFVHLVEKASDLEGGASLSRYRPGREEVLELLGAAARQDHSAIAAIALTKNLDGGALESVAHLAALPLLRAAGGELLDQIPEYWPHGYCPVCAAWPLLAERRGLDRTRRLRCGRCASEWEMEWLLCAYCGERNHQKLGSLVLEDAGDTLKVETCASCNGYLKSFATLQAIPPFGLLLKDLETVELDLAALERGYRRPAGGGVALDVEVR